MRKRKLDIDHLRVDSFETGDADALRGTVRAKQSGWDTCDIEATCALSCNPSCVVTWCTCDTGCSCDETCNCG